jgi:hypothetical protein
LAIKQIILARIEDGRLGIGQTVSIPKPNFNSQAYETFPERGSRAQLSDTKVSIQITLSAKSAADFTGIQSIERPTFGGAAIAL